MRKFLTIISIAIMSMLVACSNDSSLGDNTVVAETEFGSITSEELFQEMLPSYGSTVLIQLVDEMILNEVVTITDDMNAEADTALEQAIAQVGDEDSLVAYLQGYGIDGLDAYRELILIDIQKKSYVTDYVKALITTEDVQAYYDAYEPQITASHILAIPQPNAESNEVGEAENAAAMEIANEIVGRLDAGEAFDVLLTEYSESYPGVVIGENLGSFGTGAMVPEFEDAAFALAEGEYSSEPVKTDFGYHVILVTEKPVKKSFEDMEAEIIDTLVNDKLTNDQSIYDKSLVELREEHGFTINDSNISEFYKNFTDSLTATE